MIIAPDFKWYHWPIIIIAVLLHLVIFNPYTKIRQQFCSHEYETLFGGRLRRCKKCQHMEVSE